MGWALCCVPVFTVGWHMMVTLDCKWLIVAEERARVIKIYDSVSQKRSWKSSSHWCFLVGFSQLLQKHFH